MNYWGSSKGNNNNLYIFGGKVCHEDLQYIVQQKYPEKTGMQNSMKESKTSNDDIKQSNNLSVNLDESLKSLLIKAGVQSKHMENDQYANIIKEIAQETGKMQSKFKNKVFQSTNKTFQSVHQNAIMPPKSQLKLPNSIPPPPPPPPPPLQRQESPRQHQPTQVSRPTMGGDLLSQIQGVQLKKVVITQSQSPVKQETDSLSELLLRAINERRQELTKHKVDSPSSSQYDSDY